MDHNAAVKLGAPERYVTGDLSQAEQDEFEEHFADCRPCLNDVWTASAFAANAKAVFQDRLTREVQPRPAGRLAWLRLQTAVPAFAAVVFAVVAGYQATVMIPAMRAPLGMTAAVPLDDAQRSAPSAIEQGTPLHFALSVTAPGTTLLWVELADSAGKVLSGGSVQAPAAGEPLTVFFPVKPGPGQYSVVVRAGSSGPQLVRREFDIQPRTH
jgi:anti-sigma factor RsiW